MDNPEMKELWQRKAEEETGEISEKEADFEVFLDLADAVETSEDPTIKDLFSDLKKIIKRYYEAAERYNKLSSGGDMMAIANADEAQAMTHKALIGQLDALARAFSAARLNDSWRENIGFGRQEVGEWAYNVGKILEKNS